MTDLIHEHPKTEQTAAPAAPAPAEPPLDEKTGQKRVYGYIYLLFAVSFALLLWAFFMNQRSTDQVLSELRGSTSALQSTLDRNVALEQRVDELETEMDALRAEAELQKQEASAREQALTEERQRAAARGLLWQLEYQYAQGEYDLCRDTAGQLRLIAYALGTEGSETEPSELDRYDEIVAALAALEQQP